MGDGIIATNLHVVHGASAGYAKLVGHSETHAISGLLAVDVNADLVLLKIPGTNALALQLSDTNDVAVGDAVYAVGNPEGLEGTFSQGIVSGLRGTGSDRLLQITTPISPGSIIEGLDMAVITPEKGFVRLSEDELKRLTKASNELDRLIEARLFERNPS